MNKIVAAGLGVVVMLGLCVSSARADGDLRDLGSARADGDNRGLTSAGADGDGQDVSRRQYQILLHQCSYANTAAARTSCRADVRQTYRIGAANPSLDCRTYSGVTVCGKLTLSPSERACVRNSVAQGISYRRSEVECYAFL
ncbi:hypothetical protein [Nonomuraea roseoviolacea]|uniref:Subtilisin inhibitor domain-containing protein n=1 Tax=Nonomuraea roseoviolacea subsp. carminata TaxID=160689 RepID=A0ABT1JXL9_9ACTN|nr:hypothetical protein [Nonomuraea roseoviolacea]MCP2346503.1 hypothetical protein [Nonomuraea roseoviolacea subsp. carminata]